MLFSNKKESGVLEEMTDSRIETGTIKLGLQEYKNVLSMQNKTMVG